MPGNLAGRTTATPDLSSGIPKWNVVDYYTKGLMLSADQKHRLTPTLENFTTFTTCMLSDGHWIVATVHAGMGFKHAILPIEGRARH